MSSFFIEMGRLIRAATLPLLIVLFGLPPLLWLLNLVGVDKRPPGVTHVDQWLTRKRTTSARWLLHVSLLLEAGLEKQESIALASQTTGKRWVRRLARRFEEGADPMQESDNIVKEPTSFFGQRKFRMADTAISASSIAVDRWRSCNTSPRGTVIGPQAFSSGGFSFWFQCSAFS